MTTKVGLQPWLGSGIGAHDEQQSTIHRLGLAVAERNAYLRRLRCCQAADEC